ncbi:hypothetical protein [Asticcacaulis sp.]|uniref:hypothetical protein n=1 Tax=Asticcacaulis sp. TaxID=1872648 RepID=UPI002CC12BC7|nr:hypothetical protein [Asticcacaulis sp.]HTM81585.1 hypothetical protein [Asticcacaulis sp.]
MTPPSPMPDLTERMNAEIARLEAAAVFGRSGRMYELFRYLADRSAQGDPPKETEVTLDVFGRDHRADGQDGIARVYIHRLRKKLESYYAAHDSIDDYTLSLPKGEYRFVIERVNRPAPALPAHEWFPVRKLAEVWPWLAGLLVINLLIWGAVWYVWPKGEPAIVAARQSEVWRPMLTKNRPLLIVVGDYYMFGDYQGGMELKRLVRDFSIDSKSDLLDYLTQYPEKAGDYADVGLSYLPTSEALALRSVLPLVPADLRMHVVPSSALTSNMMQYNNVLYIGLTGSLGKLKDSVFSHGRFSLGENYDEIIDGQTQKHYFAQNPFDEKTGNQTGYGLVSAYQGPSGSRIMVVAGTNDAALTALSRFIAEVGRKDIFSRQIADKPNYEALFEVNSRDALAGQPRLIALSRRDTRTIWTDRN